MRRSIGSALLTILTALAGPALHAQQSVVTGQVTDAASKQPLSDVQVRVVGSPRAAITNETGQFRLAGIPAGTHTLRAQRIGYAPVTQTISVSAGATLTADFALTATAVEIDQVVVTATGETQRKRETGNTVAVVQAPPERLAVSANVSEVLQAQAPGVYINQAGGTLGSANRIRIRGAASISLTNEPLIIIDGVRANNSIGGQTNDGTIGVGGQQSSRLNDLNPEDIESIEVLKGPSAASMYGTAAANGVIQIRTKRGRSGRPRWTLFGEGGQQKDTYDYPANYFRIGDPDGRDSPCTLDAEARQECTPFADSLFSFNPLEQANPFRTGTTTSFGGSVAGGADIASYFVSGALDKNQGVYDPNKFNRASLRANVTGSLRQDLTLQVSTNYIASRLGFPQNDNNVLGVFGGGLLGSAFDDPASRGYLAGQRPDEIFAIDTDENIERFIGGATANWAANRWLSAVANVGVDYVDRRNRETIPPNKVFFGDLPEGSREANTADLWNYTANGSLTANFELPRGIRSTTTVSAQYNRDVVEVVLAQGAKLVAGSGSLQGTSARFAVGELNTDNRTVGGIIQQQFAWRDRLFLAGGLRTDNNSAFGEKFGWITYPSASVSYVLSDESWFPRSSVLSALRLRASYGRSGQRPNFRDAITYFNTQTVTVDGTDVPGITVGGTGNADLRPELSTEYEGGFELGFFDQRIAFEATYFNKSTEDLLIARPLPPSLGLTTTQFANLGKSRNSGLEFLLRGEVFNTRAARLELTLTASQTRNKLLDIGKLPSGEPIPPILLGIQRHAEGFPLGGYWDEPISFQDKNGDGIITRVNCPGQAQVAGGPECEMDVGTTQSYLGNPFPTREWSFSPRLTLFSWMQLSALVDHRGGFKIYNLTERFRCNFSNCRAAYDPAAGLFNQARNLGQLMNTDAGYIEDGTYTKLREVAVTLTAPRSWTSRLGTEQLSVTLAGKNLATWTDYSGFDPEVNSTPGGNFNTSDFLTQPPLRIWTVRLNLAF